MPAAARRTRAHSLPHASRCRPAARAASKKRHTEHFVLPRRGVRRKGGATGEKIYAARCTPRGCFGDTTGEGSRHILKAVRPTEEKSHEPLQNDAGVDR